MGKEYPSYVDVVKTAEADFLINYPPAHKTGDQLMADHQAGRKNTSDRILADFPVDAFAFESIDRGITDRYNLSQVTARVLSTQSRHAPPIVINSDIGWPRDHPEQLKAEPQSAQGFMGPLGLAVLLAKAPKEKELSRRRILQLGGLAVLGASLASPEQAQAGQVDESKLWLNSPYFIDGRSAYHALTYKAMAPVIKQRSGLERKPVIAIDEGSLHRKGIKRGYGLPDLLADEKKVAEILERDKELINGGINAPKVSIYRMIWLYEFNPALGKYNTIHFYKPDGEITPETKFTHERSWSPKPKE
jgi:hypothetical protein